MISENVQLLTLGYWLLVLIKCKASMTPFLGFTAGLFPVQLFNYLIKISLHVLVKDNR